MGKPGTLGTIVPLDEAAERLRLPAALLARRLAAPGSFFASGLVKSGDEITGITERLLKRLMQSRLEQLYTVPEAAELLGLHPQTLRRAIQAGRLPALDVLGELRLSESALVSLLRPDPRSFFSRGRKAAP